MKGYYVTVVRGKLVGWLAGPFSCVEDAGKRVGECRRLARDIDPWTDFDAFGVTMLERAGDLPTGVLHDRIALDWVIESP